MGTIKSKPHFNEELTLWNQGYTVIGLDEVGRGAFAGPLVVAAVVFDSAKKCSEYLQKNIDDSKRLSAKKRTELSKYIRDEALTFQVASVSVQVINKIGIGKSTFLAFRKVVREIGISFATSKKFILVDGFYIPYVRGFGLKNQKAIVRGDQESISIAAASILAKVYRDNLMERLHPKYVTYNFSSNKGYGTLHHRQMIRKHGLTTIHRTAFCNSTLSALHPRGESEAAPADKTEESREV